MKFDQRQWVNDIVTGAVTGVAAGAVGALLVPEPPLMYAMFAGGVVGLVTGVIKLPLEVFLNFRPQPDATDSVPKGVDDHET